jgi:hypothetical protein
MPHGFVGVYEIFEELTASIFKNEVNMPRL